MVMRVTNLTQQRSALNNIFRITEDLFNAQKEITSGKQIHKPSDDPAGMRDTLALRTSIKQIKQFVKVPVLCMVEKHLIRLKKRK